MMNKEHWRIQFESPKSKLDHIKNPEGSQVFLFHTYTVFYSMSMYRVKHKLRIKRKTAILAFKMLAFRKAFPWAYLTFILEISLPIIRSFEVDKCFLSGKDIKGI